MKILLIGSGGREHALGWQFVSHGHQLISTPGNPGLAKLGRCLDIGVGEISRLVEVAVSESVDLVVVGPEAPLVNGLADALREAGVDVFGPGASGARLEGSKAFSKDFFVRHRIRSAAFRLCTTDDDVTAALASIGPQVVVKVDGLAAGKGVVVCADADAARAAVSDLRRRFGPAAETVLIEQRLSGRELSVMAICDGQRVEILAQAEDHKQLGDGDVGPNTGGMGTVSPAPWASRELLARVQADIFAPTLRGLASDNIDFRGVLYAGLMVDDDGVPWILEYNCRFGDPETQPLMVRLISDLADSLRAAARGDLGGRTLEWRDDVAVCVVLATAGYPQRSQKGVLIEGLDRLGELADYDATVIFHAGTANPQGPLVTAGGRVLGVTARGTNVDQARQRAYAAVSAIAFEGMQFRRDIGYRDG